MSTLVISEEQYNRIFLKSKNTLVITESQYKRIVLGEQGVRLPDGRYLGPGGVSGKTTKQKKAEKKFDCDQRKKKYGIMETYGLISNVCNTFYWDEGNLELWSSRLKACVANKNNIIVEGTWWTPYTEYNIKYGTLQANPVDNPDYEWMTHTGGVKMYRKKGTGTWHSFWGDDAKEFKKGKYSVTKDWKNNRLQIDGPNMDKSILTKETKMGYSTWIWNIKNWSPYSVKLKTSNKITGQILPNVDRGFFKLGKIPKLNEQGGPGGNLTSSRGGATYYDSGIPDPPPLQGEYESEATLKPGQTIQYHIKIYNRYFFGQNWDNSTLSYKQNGQDLAWTLFTGQKQKEKVITKKIKIPFEYFSEDTCSVAKSGVKSQLSEYETKWWTHTILDVAAIAALFIPYVGWAISMGLEAINGGLYIYEGNTTVGAISLFLSVIPGVGKLRHLTKSKKLLGAFDNTILTAGKKSIKDEKVILKLLKENMEKAGVKNVEKVLAGEQGKNLLKMIKVYMEADPVALKNMMEYISKNKTMFNYFTKQKGPKFTKYMKAADDDLGKAFKAFMKKEARNEAMMTAVFYGTIIYNQDNIGKGLNWAWNKWKGQPDAAEYNKEQEEILKKYYTEEGKRMIDTVGEWKVEEALEYMMPAVDSLLNDTLTNNQSTSEYWPIDENDKTEILKNIITDNMDKSPEEVALLINKINNDIKKEVNKKHENVAPPEIDPSRKNEGAQIVKNEQDLITAEGRDIPSKDNYIYKFYKNLYFTKNKNKLEEDWVLIKSEAASEKLDARWIKAGNEPETNGQAWIVLQNQNEYLKTN